MRIKKKRPKIHLVDDWKNAWKWISMNCMVIAAALQGAWIYIPEDLRDNVPPDVINLLTVSLLAMGVLGRLVKQEKPPCG